MPSFDIVNEIDIQKLDNAINVARKEIVNRYDFHGSKTEMELDKKEMTLKITTENEMRMNAIRDIIISRSMKQGVDPKCFDFGKDHYASGNMVRKDVKVKKGIDKETAKTIVKYIKETGMKVQASSISSCRGLPSSIAVCARGWRPRCTGSRLSRCTATQDS